MYIFRSPFVNDFKTILALFLGDYSEVCPNFGRNDEKHYWSAESGVCANVGGMAISAS